MSSGSRVDKIFGKSLWRYLWDLWIIWSNFGQLSWPTLMLKDKIFVVVNGQMLKNNLLAIWSHCWYGLCENKLAYPFDVALNGCPNDVAYREGRLEEQISRESSCKKSTKICLELLSSSLAWCIFWIRHSIFFRDSSSCLVQKRYWLYFTRGRKLY